MSLVILHDRLSKPAGRALDNAGITTVEQLTSFSEKELLQLHGMGKKGIVMINTYLAEQELSLKDS